MKTSYFFVLIISLLLQSCSTSPPVRPDNICEVFKEKTSWYRSALDMQEKWGVPVHIPFAIMYQESAFKADAKPPMRYFLGFIPTGRGSSAYGYPQAQDMTWDDYTEETGNSWSSRDNFDDALDFVGWYIAKTYTINKVSKWDAYQQYLNYHEGWYGFQKKTFKKKPWLIKVAKKVDKRARRYSAQYQRCKDDLDSSWLF